MELTPRDAEILRLLRRHRFLRSHHIATLLDDSRQQLIRRLQKLFHHGYVERPPCQLDYFHRAGSRAMIHGLGNRGAAFLHRTEDSPVSRNDWNTRNRSATRLFLDHALMISDVLIALEAACRSRGDVRLHHADEFAHSVHGDVSLWHIAAQGSERIAVIPDAIFTLTHSRPNDTTDTVLCCLEADRGTMPVQSANAHRSSITRKLTAYEASWRTNIFRQRFDATRVQVLTVTTSDARRDSIQSCASTQVTAAGLFHFTTLEGILVSPDHFLDALLARQPAPVAQRVLTSAPRPAT